MNFKKYFTKPRIIAIIGDVNSGKSLTDYYILKELREKFNFNLYTFGLKNDIKGEIKINSVKEAEQADNSIVNIDEMPDLFDFDDRKKKKEIEKTLRVINHNNNIILLVGLPENFKKFISSKIDIVCYKKCTHADFINGSTVKNTLMDYKGPENGSSILKLKPNEVIIYDGTHYEKIIIPYLKNYDTKLKNKDILIKKEIKPKCSKKSAITVPNFVEKEKKPEPPEEELKPEFVEEIKKIKKEKGIPFENIEQLKEICS